MKAVVLCLVVVGVWGSPTCVSDVEELRGVDEDCFGDDLTKVCGVGEGQCREKCNSDIRCGAYVVNYLGGEGPNPKWEDGCCWLKKACTKVKPMQGKTRQIVRNTNLIPPTPHPFIRSVKGLYYGVADATNTALDAFLERLKKGKKSEMEGAVGKWVEEKRRDLANPKEDGDVKIVAVEAMSFSVPKLKY